MKHRNYAKILTLFLTIGLCATLVSCASFGLGSKTVRIEDYVQITFDDNDYNGYATPSIIIDEEGLDKYANTEKLAEFNKENEVTFGWEEYTLSDLLDISFAENYKNLSNGDKIVVKISIQPALESEGLTLDKLCDGLDIKIESTEIEYTVSGLEEPKNVIDIFEGIEQYIPYVGANGSGYVDAFYQVNIPDDYSKQIDDVYFSKGSHTNSVKIIHGNTNIGEISYHIEGQNLKKGDILELTAGGAIGALEGIGYVVPTTKINVTVPDLGEYLTSQEQLTPEIIEEIKATVFENGNIDIIDKFYYVTYKPGVECKYKSPAFIVAVFYEKDSWFSGYYIDELNDIIIKPDGTIVVEKYKDDSYSDDTLEEAIGKLDTKRYEFVELE